MVFVYLGILIFMQPILISIASIGIMTIEWMGSTVGDFMPAINLLYFGLIIMLVVVACMLIVGPAIFGKLIKFGSRALL
jgi:hypothetical protein